MSPQAKHKLERDLKFKARFDHLYNVDRLRPDDVWAQLAKEFFVTETTLRRRLNTLDERMAVKPSNQLSIAF